MSITDEIKARVDAVEFISRYVPLQRAGRSFKACCPFHQERTPSFVVFPDSGLWHCFGACGTGGDIFSFLMQKENMDFREALQALAREAGVELPEEGRDRASQDRAVLYEMNACAAQFFSQQLHRNPRAQEARGYLSQRGINAEVATQFQLGYAPDGWDALQDHLMAKGYSAESLHRADLVKHSEERDSYYDTFRNRLTFPIFDRQRRVIGFGARVLDGSVPKYLNTAETPLFHKSNAVYGLERAYKSIRQTDSVVIVEGYMDVIAAHQFGFANVVACLGTALTEAQLLQLHRYTDNFILALDADSAGQQAALRGLNQARQALKRKAKPVLTATGREQMEHRLSANLRIGTLPEGSDPDDIIRRGDGAWQQLMENAAPLVDHYFKIVAKDYDLESARGKGQAVAELSPLIAELDEAEERQHYIEWLSRLAGFPIHDRTVEQRVQAASFAQRRPAHQGEAPRRRFTQPQERQNADETEPPVGSEVGGRQQLDERLGADSRSGSALLSQELSISESEGFLLSLLICDPDLLIWLSEEAQVLEIGPLRSSDFQRIEYRELFEALRSFIASDEIWSIEVFQETLKPEYHPALSDLMTELVKMPEREQAEIHNALRKLLIRLRDSRQRKNLSAMQSLLQDAQESDDRETVREYSAIIGAIQRDRYHLDRLLGRISQVSYGAAPFETGIAIA